jgi:DUF4097 and DUF4098 domain-containing protein YvlB
MVKAFKIGTVAAFLILSAALTGCLTDDWVTEDFDGEYDATEGTILKIDNVNGYVEITGWAGDKVVLHAVKRSFDGQDGLDRVEVKVTEGTGQIDIETEYDSSNHEASVNMELKVPTFVIVQSVDCSNGHIILKGTSGNSTLESSNGYIEVEDVDGFVSVSSSNGRIDVKDTKGIFDVSSSNGDLDVEVSAIAGATEISTSNGRIEVRIDPSVEAELDITSSNGDVDTHNLVIEDKSATDQHVTGRLGTGGPMITISSSNGNIDVYELS